MGTEPLVCEAMPARPWSGVRISGALTVSGAPSLRTAVLKCLAEEPTAVLIDLAGVGEVDDAALMVFPALARAAAAWPGIRVVLHSVPAPVAARLRALAVTRMVPVLPDEAAAIAEVTSGRGPLLIREPLTGERGVLAHARTVVREACRGMGRAALADPAEMVAGELVANALRHAPGPRSLTVSTSAYHLHVAVRDAGTGRVRIRDRDDDGEPGRGLRIVEALSTAWGCTPTADGKAVWATLRVPRGTGG